MEEKIRNLIHIYKFLWCFIVGYYLSNHDPSHRVILFFQFEVVQDETLVQSMPI